MDWLGGWLKSVVLIVLLAAFIDLLLPNYTMQRYVKMAISLFLLVTLLTPVFQLFQKDWNFNELLNKAEAAQAQFINFSGPDLNNRLSLHSIMGESEKLKENAALQSRKLLEEQTAQWIADDIEQEYGNLVKEVKVSAEIDSRGEAKIRQVTVDLSYDDAVMSEARQARAEESRSVQAEPRGMKPVETIRPIQIEIDRIDPFQSERLAAVDAISKTPALELLQERIRQTIQRTLQVPVGQIIVSFS